MEREGYILEGVIRKRISGHAYDYSNFSVFPFKTKAEAKKWVEKYEAKNKEKDIESFEINKEVLNSGDSFSKKRFKRWKG